VKNTGQAAGKEIIQLYVRDVESNAFRPEKELKGFAKVELQPGQETRVSIELDSRAFAYYNTDLKQWHVESGAYEILIGASSRDIRLSAAVEMSSSQPPAPAVDRQALRAYYDLPQGARFSQADFESLLGRPVPENELVKGEPYTLNTPLVDMQDSFVARLLSRFTARRIQEMIKDDPDSPTSQMIQAVAGEITPRLMLMMGGEQFTRQVMDGLMLLINGRYLKGLAALLRARRAQADGQED
jgi:beta-glucosidase